MSYIHSLNALKSAIEMKITKLSNRDKKEDFKIMLKNVDFLLAHSLADFNM
jgi:hypothetical protein